MFHKILLILKFMIGKLSIKDGSVCEFSEVFFDAHDYPEWLGGDGYPSHFYEYTCPRCHKKWWL